MVAFGEPMDPEIVMRPLPRWPEPGPFVGREAVLRQCVRLREAWNSDDVAKPFGDLVPLADKVVGRIHYAGQGSGPAAIADMSCVFTVREGRMAGMDFYWDHAEALEAAGLRSDGDG